MIIKVVMIILYYIKFDERMFLMKKSRVVGKDLLKSVLNSDHLGVVLNGGGTKGIKQLGALLCLSEMGITIDGYAGVSIGSINCLIAAGMKNRLKEALEFYLSIPPAAVVPNKKLNFEKSIFDIKNLSILIKGFIEKKGYSNNLLGKFLESDLFPILDWQELKTKDIGFITLKIFPKKEAIMKFLDEVEEYDLIDFLLSSCNFPIYAPKEIEGCKYVDGGLYNNQPVEMLVKKGYKEILVLDAKGPGIKRSIKKFQKLGIKIVIIKLESKIGVFDFNRGNLISGFCDSYSFMYTLMKKYDILRR